MSENQEQNSVAKQKRSSIVAFSGGLDSTYLVYLLMKEHRAIDLITADYSKQNNQSKRQNASIKKIVSELDNLQREKKLPGSIKSVEKNSFFPYHKGAMGLGQNVPWLTILLQNLRRIDQDVFLGYINGDSVIPYLNDTRQAWSWMLSASAIDNTFYKLYTPLVNYKKHQILSDIPASLLKLVTWCEGAQVEDDCGTCPSCIAMQLAYEEYKIHNRSNKLCPEFKTRMKNMSSNRRLSKSSKGKPALN